jgi:uncharacterized protein YeeX (DUF496 family)
MKKETSVKLHLYFEGELSEEEVHSSIADMVSDYEEIFGKRVEYQIHEVEVDDYVG